MNGAEDEKQARKAALDRLRETRRQAIELAALKMKKQKKTIHAIRRLLKDGDKTVPELAEGAEIAASEAMFYVATLKKYGEVVEGEKDGGYFRYRLAGAAAISVNVPGEG